jgi:hypothetical protein
MLALLPLLLAVASSATPRATTVWDLKAGNQTILRLDVEETPSGMTGIYERPEHLGMDNESFSEISGPLVRRPSRSVRMVEGDIELTFDDPAPHSTPDIFRLHRIDADHATVTYEGTSFEPFDFVRAQARTPLGPWDPTRTYIRTIVRPTNAEMTAIFDADQADRQSPKIDWSVVGPADRKRQARTQQLLDSGALHSGEDFYHAAFVFQHGSVPGDHLKAHLLAMIAIARGKPGAVWIASATLDRYLQDIGKPQVLGTQFHLPQNAPVNQEPYDRALVPDAMRTALQVPIIAKQLERERRLQEEVQAANTPAN